MYTLSDHAVNVPELNRIDELAEQRERRDQRTRARMSKQAYKAAILQRISDMLDDRYHPLGDLVETLFQCPVRDQFDWRAVVEMKDGKRIGATIVCAVADVSLESYQDADLEGF